MMREPMIRELMMRADAAAARRVAMTIDRLVEAAGAELPADLIVERLGDGIAIAGDGLVRRLAFDGRLRGLTAGAR